MSRFIAVFSSNPQQVIPRLQNLSPRVEQHPPDGLLLEIPDHHESRILQQLFERAGDCSRLRIGVASRRLVALLAARIRPGRSIPRGQEREFLAPLPVSTLSLIAGPFPESLFQTLSRWGIYCLGELADLPASELSARLGPEGTHLQRLARGEEPVPLQSYPEKARFQESRELEWVLENLQSLDFIMGGMLEPLCDRLSRRGLAAAALHLVLKLSGQGTHESRINLARPTSNPRLLLSLLRLNLQSAPPRAGVEKIQLELIPAPARFRQYSLLEESRLNPEKLSRTLARLSALLGEENVGSPALLDTHRPDSLTLHCFDPGSGEGKRRASGGGTGASPAPAGEDRAATPSRPPAGSAVSASQPASERTPLPPENETFQNPGALVLRRFRPPRPFRIHFERIVACAGPWRSSGDWWSHDEQPHKWSRDEWEVETTDGSILRIYWDHHRKSWFLDGVYD